MVKLAEITSATPWTRKGLEKSGIEQGLWYDFEDFWSDKFWDHETPLGRRFIQYLPNIPWGGITPLYDVPNEVQRALSRWIGYQRTLTEEAQTETWNKKCHYSISSIDLPTLNWIDLIGKWGKLDDEKIREALDVFFYLKNTAKTDPEYEQKVLKRLNSTLNYSLYAYNYIYFKNVPQELKKFRFETFDDVKTFLTRTMREWVFRHVYCEILKHMVCFNYALHKKTVAKWDQYLKKLESKLAQDFIPDGGDDENGISTWFFEISLNDETHRVPYKKRSRAKDIFSCEQKLIGNPKENDESIFNDILWVEYIFQTKEDIMFFLFILFEKYIAPNRTAYLSEMPYSWTEVDTHLMHSFLEAFEFRQKSLLDEKDIEDFVTKYWDFLTGAFIYVLRKLNKVKKTGTSDDYQDIKFQGKYNFWSSLWVNTIEIRCVLEDNLNEKGLWNSAIRKWLKTILAQIRKWYYVTENYVYRVAYISHLKSKKELSIEEIFKYYLSELSPFSYTSERGKEVSVDWVYTSNLHAERLKKHWFTAIWLKNYQGIDLK